MFIASFSVDFPTPKMITIRRKGNKNNAAKCTFKRGFPLPVLPFKEWWAIVDSNH